MRAVATLEIRDAGKLSEIHALSLGRKIATSLATKIIKKGAARAELHIRRYKGINIPELLEWLEDQGLKLIVDREEYGRIYKAVLYQ